MFKIIADFQASALVIAIDFEVHLGWRLAWRPIGNWKVWPSENSFWSNSLYLQKIHLRTDQFWYLPKIMITAGYQISIFAHLWAQLSAKVLISLKHVGKFLQMWDMIILQSHPYQQHHNHHCHQDTWIRKRQWSARHLDKKETSGWGNPLPGVDAAVEEQHRIWSFWTAMSIITTTTWTFGETAVLRKWTISLGTPSKTTQWKIILPKNP